VKPDKESLSITLESKPEYAVVLSALTHGLRLARINPDVYEYLSDETVFRAREICNGMLSTSIPELPFDLPYDGAKTAVAGIRSALFGSNRIVGQSITSRIKRKRIGDELKHTFLALAEDHV
jgi:hypothetical protein